MMLVQFKGPPGVVSPKAALRLEVPWGSEWGDIGPADPPVKGRANPRRTAISHAESINSLSNRLPTLAGIRAAANALARVAVVTPLIEARIRGETVFVKAECLQRT